MVTLADLLQTQNSLFGGGDRSEALNNLSQALMSGKPFGQAYQEQMRNQAMANTMLGHPPGGATQEQAINGLMASQTGLPPKYALDKDAYGNVMAINPYNPSQNMQVGAGGPFTAISPNNTGEQVNQPEKATGDEFLKTLPDQTAAQVKALAEGRMQFPGGFALKSPYWQQMIAAVSQYDPSFDAVNYNARAATRKDFTSGKSAQNITALNTALGHINSLLDSSEALNNSSNTWFNKAVNSVESSALGDPRVKTFETNRDAVASELTRVFRGSGGSAADVADWKKKLDSANSPAQFQSVAKEMADLLGSRLDSVGQQYNQGMGTSKEGIDLLSPKAQNAFKRITGEAPERTNAGADGQYDLTTPSGIKYRVVK